MRSFKELSNEYKIYITKDTAIEKVKKVKVVDEAVREGVDYGSLRETSKIS